MYHPQSPEERRAGVVIRGGSGRERGFAPPECHSYHHSGYPSRHSIDPQLHQQERGAEILTRVTSIEERH